MRTIAQKLGFKPGHAVRILHPPADPAVPLDPLPEGLRFDPAEGEADGVLCFVASRADLAARWPQARAAVRPGGVVWVAYPKKSGPLKTDISRDEGWEPVIAEDWHGVSQVAVDETWSALRFRPRHEIKKMTRKF